mgnify:FL=1|tara:strand:- start:48 stop:464 length:417 start_codon:yes stop_codon:yes gene_type:complete
MKMYFLIKNIKKIIYFFSLLIILAIFTNAFYNFYAIIKRPYDERLMWNYGFDCEKYSYGFIQKIFQNHPHNQSITIINFKNLPNIQYLFHNKKIDESRKNLILLNLTDESKLKDFEIDLKKYDLVKNTNNCYFYKKND